MPAGVHQLPHMSHLGSLCDHDTFTRSDPAAPRRRPLARDSGLLPRRTSAYRPGVSLARGADSAASAGSDPGPPCFSSGSARARPTATGALQPSLRPPG